MSEIHPVAVPVEFPADHAAALQALTYGTVMIDVMLDADHVPPTAARIGWVTANQTFSDWLDGEITRTGPQKRKSVDVLLFQDLSREIGSAARIGDNCSALLSVSGLRGCCCVQALSR